MKKLKFPIVVTAIIVGAIFLIGFIPRLFNLHELKTMNESTVGAPPVVHTVKAEPAPFKETGELPGNIDAVQNANIYARIDGYLKRRLVDIGSVVKKGQLLAEIDTPTTDEELAQSKADLAQANAQLKEAMAKLVAAKAQIDRAQADLNYASITATRWENMAAKGAVTLQSRDEKVRGLEAQTASLKEAKAEEVASESAVQVAKALVVARQANVNRWLAQQAFKMVVAPFDGVITDRNVDAGALITSGSQSSSLQLFKLAQIDVLRIYINVPQSLASYVEVGQNAKVMVQEFSGRIFEGTIANVSGALDPNTRTRQTEVRINNKDHTLLPGMYATVEITVDRTEPWVKIPSNALVPKGDGMYVVVVRDDKASFTKVELGRDFGDQIEIRYGLKKGDVVALSPPVDLQPNEKVQAVPVEAE